MFRAILLAALAISAAAKADVYKCTNEAGKTVYQAKPCVEGGDTGVGRLPELSATERAEAAKRMQVQMKIAEAEAKRVSIQKRRASEPDLDNLLKAVEKWEESAKLARSTARIALAGPVAKLQEIKASAKDMAVSDCYKPARAALVGWMDLGIDELIEFMSKNEIAAMLKQVQAISAEREFYLAVPDSCPPI